MEIKKVAVIGTGRMGPGIAQVCAQSGYQTKLRGRTEQSVARGMEEITTSLSRSVERHRMTAQDKAAIVGRLKGVTALEDLSDCDLVIESIIEEIGEKKKLFASLDALCPPHTILATNTSSLPAIEMAASTNRPHQVAGIHFIYPPHVMRLVEVVRTLVTSQETVNKAKEFAESLGKTVIVAKDTPGFVFNRLLIPYLMDAVRLLEAGVATKEDIDASMKHGFGYRWGPLEVIDEVGVDLFYRIAEIMYEEFKDAKYAPPPLLKRMFLAGHWGRRTGKGFYDYPQG